MNNKNKNTPTKKDMQKYERYLEKEAKKFRLTATDLSNLYDLLSMVDTPDEIPISMRRTLKLNNMGKWFYDLMDRIEKVVIVFEPHKTD